MVASAFWRRGFKQIRILGSIKRGPTGVAFGLVLSLLGGLGSWCDDHWRGLAAVGIWESRYWRPHACRQLGDEFACGLHMAYGLLTICLRVASQSGSDEFLAHFGYAVFRDSSVNPRSWWKSWRRWGPIPTMQCRQRTCRWAVSPYNRKLGVRKSPFFQKHWAKHVPKPLNRLVHLKTETHKPSKNRTSATTASLFGRGLPQEGRDGGKTTALWLVGGPGWQTFGDDSQRWEKVLHTLVCLKMFLLQYVIFVYSGS